MPEGSDLPDVEELRTTLSYITGRVNRPDGRTRARDHETLTSMQSEVNETLRRERPPGYATDDELRALLEQINTALGDG